MMTVGIRKLGFGCSRLGSLGGIGKRESRDLLEWSASQGVRFFDTAATYGQGDSERFLGELLRAHPSLMVATKVGKVSPTKSKMMSLLKEPLRLLVRKVPILRSMVVRTRGGELPTCFSTNYLETQLKSSFKRLGVLKIPIVFLHNPSSEVIDKGNAIEFLDSYRKEGRIGMVGVSVSDYEDGRAALRDARVGAVQIPFFDTEEFGDFLQAAKEVNKFVVVREVMKGIEAVAKNDKEPFLRSRLSVLVSNQNIDIVLIGTTKRAHLAEILTVFKHL